MSQKTGAVLLEWSLQMAEFKRKLRFPASVQPMFNRVPIFRARHWADPANNSKIMATVVKTGSALSCIVSLVNGKEKG